MAKSKSSKKRNAENQNTNNIPLPPRWLGIIFVIAGISIFLGALQARLNNAENTNPATTNNGSVSEPVDIASLPSLISPAQYQGAFVGGEVDYLLLDVRTPQEFNGGHIDGAINIPVQELAQRISEVPADQPIVVYCRSGNRSATATDILTGAGYEDVYDIAGGTVAWSAAGYPLQ